MQYDVVTIDTNIFRRYGWQLEEGMLGQLAQFKEGSVQFCLSEIVLREIYKHLTIEAKAARETIDKARRESRKNNILTTIQAEQLDELWNSIIPAAEASKNRIRAFQERTGMSMIPVKHADIEELVRRYFKPSAPFQPTGNKKHEFPDAIALLSIEKWALSREKKILAISDDKGWKAFGDGSSLIDVVDDFAKALQLLQNDAEEGISRVRAVLSDISGDDRLRLLSAIEDGVAEAVSEMDVYADAHSAFQYDAELVTLLFQGFQFLGQDDEYEFSIVQIGRNKIVVRIAICIRATAECVFSFFIKDSIDKDYVPMGNARAETDTEFDAAILTTFEGNFSSFPAHIMVTELELVEVIDSVDFGLVEPDYEEEIYYQEEE